MICSIPAPVKINPSFRVRLQFIYYLFIFLVIIFYFFHCIHYFKCWYIASRFQWVWDVKLFLLILCILAPMGVLPKLITFCFSSHFSILSSFSIFSSISKFSSSFVVFEFIGSSNQIFFCSFFSNTSFIVFTPVEPVSYSTPDSVLPSLSPVHYVSISGPSLQVIVSERSSFIHSLSFSILSSNTSILIFLNLLHSFSTNLPEHLELVEIKRYLQKFYFIRKMSNLTPFSTFPETKAQGFLTY